MAMEPENLGIDLLFYNPDDAVLDDCEIEPLVFHTCMCGKLTNVSFKRHKKSKFNKQYMSNFGIMVKLTQNVDVSRYILSMVGSNVMIPDRFASMLHSYPMTY